MLESMLTEEIAPVRPGLAGMHAALLRRIENRTAKVGVVGLGYVGLPLGMAFAEAGFCVLGLDIDQKKIDHVNRGESYIKHIEKEPIAKLVENKKLAASTDFSRVEALDCVIICVPTPLNSAR